MSGEYVLILGAGLMQKRAFEASRKYGYKILCVDANPNAVCVPLADEFFCIDLKDKEKIANLALGYKNSLKAVFTCGTDFSISVSYVAEKCNLISHTFNASQKTCSKVLMRQCFHENKIPSPDFTEITNALTKEELDSIKNKIIYPKVIKPSDNMGARGCRLIRNKEEFSFAVEDAINNSRTKTAILEDYMSGKEFSIDAIVHNGTFTVTGFADRHIYFPPYFIELGHTLPSNIDESSKNKLISTFADAVHSLGLTCGVAKADIKLTEKGPMIGEIAARLSGGYMSGWTFPYASNFDLTGQALLIALGKEPGDLLSNRRKLHIENKYFELYEVPCTKFSAERSYISIPGVIKKITFFNDDFSIANDFVETELVKNFFPRVKENACVDFPRNNVQKCGNFIAVASSYESASQYAENASSRIILELESFNAQTNKFLNSIENDYEKGFPYSAYKSDSKEAGDLIKLFENIKIKLNEKVLSYIPENIFKSLDLVKDYNYRSILTSIKMFDILRPNHIEIDGKLFVNFLLRGGVQGILYLCDSYSQFI